MSTVVEEVGTLVAENVREILEDGAFVEGGPDARLWSVLVRGGWGSISADPDNGMELRDVLEVARVSGRYPVSTPLVSTLLAGRWFDLAPAQLEAGVVPALRRGREVVAPYWTHTTTVVDGEGRPVTEIGPPQEPFALLVPVVTLPGDTAPVDGAHLVEARAAYLAVAVGCADSVIARSVEWAQTREQFGTPLKAFQAVRHHLANAHIAREQAWTAAIAAAHEPEHSGRWARQGFALVRTAIELGIQVHGGVGFTWEVGLQHPLNQVVELDSLFGDQR